MTLRWKYTNTISRYGHHHQKAILQRLVIKLMLVLLQKAPQANDLVNPLA